MPGKLHFSLLQSQAHREKDLIAPIKSFNQNTFNRNDIIFDYSN